MEWKRSGSTIFLRVDPSEGLVQSLVTLADEANIEVAAITSGVGMLEDIEMGFFNVDRDDYDRTTFAGIHDLSSIQGNITRRDGKPVPHVHAVFNDTAYRTLSGHVIEASCHITMEMFLSVSDVAIQRVKLPGCPATRIVAAPSSKHA